MKTLLLSTLLIFSVAYAQDDELVDSNSIIEALGGENQTRAAVMRRKIDPTGMSIDLKIEFEYDSSDLTNEATGQLNQLLTALRHPKLREYRFQIVGHTDAKGDETYNLGLSMRRADTVKAFLAARGIEKDRLDVEGKGESELLLPHKPDNEANRRVEIINSGANDTANQ